ncbi:centrosomal protein cep290 [Drosophila albomicans]|uniref:Centrosomal protein cep290 n=1 Tax=Drosophila albomicans TaxID=7291 RepID=A0A6P8WR36_DROAB|nr:centrosomal protein cep290 [Drosophila albomicans]
MEIPDTVSVRRFREFSPRQKHELYETLLELSETLEELPKRSLRKTLELTLAVLEYKGELAQKLESSGERRVHDENEKLKRMVQKLEDERDNLKQKTKELSEEINRQQQQLREAALQAEASDKDSSDPLSELDKQEQLLHNIDTKNKHIKRLLREIDSLQNQNIVQSKTIALNEQELQQIKTRLVQISQDITQVEQERKSLQQTMQQQSLEVTRLEGNVTFLEDEREKQELEMRQFLEKHETQALSWRTSLEQKEQELQQLRKQLEHNKITGHNLMLSSASSSQIQMDEEQTRLRHLLELREQRIETLEAKLKSVADEMASSTKLMNQLSLQRETSLNPQKPRACCQLIEERLRAANARAQQLAELLDSTEQDNVLKAKQALHSLTALESYKRGEDGLVPALRRCAGLEQKLSDREKQLRSYTQELNAMHELAQENEVLRRRLNIPDDVVVLSKQVRAKQRNKDKQIERLTLKLRTSEELRLQLKLEKSELRRKLLERQPLQAESLHHQQQQPSEMGEVPSSAPLENSPRRGQGDGAASSELQTKYEDVLAENETLRMGMYEILEKMREYDATSDHITIDSELLRRLIDALPGGAATPQRLQSQLQELKAREEALCQLLQQNVSESETGELSSVHSMRDVSEMPDEQLESSSNVIDTATRPTTPNELNEALQLPIISENGEREAEQQARPSSAELGELVILRKHYEEMRLHMAADGDELTRYNLELHEQQMSLERQLQEQSSSYGYMRADYDQLLTQLKQQELRYIQDIAGIQKQLEQQKSQLAAKTEQLSMLQRTQPCTAEERQQLEQRNARLSMQLAQAIEQLLGELKLQDICADYGIIEDNYQLSYVTAQEFEQQRQELATWRHQQAELQRENKQLEGLLQVANGQIQSQQKLLNEITDNHINLRHLVADLQSSSGDKLLMAKMQRDLDAAKAETVRLELAHKDVQQHVAQLETQLQAAEQLATETQQQFQLERSSSDIKQKFLQRSLFTLKEKYAKFTPLIFLNNFVFAYQKFHKSQQQLPPQESSDNSTLVEQVLQAVQSKLSPHEENSQQLIKLIKSETQTKLLEQRCESLQLRQIELQQELSELRLQHATDSEHWQTIQALFGHTSAEETKESKVDVATNTIGAAPVPAMRRTAQLIDKQSSPIGSPSRRLSSQDMAIQTEQAAAVQLMETAVQTNGSQVEKQPQQQQQPQQPQQQQQQHQAVQTAQEQLTNDLELQQLKAALQAANVRIDELTQQLETSIPPPNPSSESDSQHSGVVEKTILSFHTLLLEKDQSIQKYQDLLQTEREQNQQLITKQSAENETLKATVNNLNFNIKTKDQEILELKSKLELQKTPDRVTVPSTDNSLNELTDERIEEMFEHSSTDRSPERQQEQEEVEQDLAVGEDEVAGEEEKQDTEELKELPTLHKQIKELKDKLIYCEQNLVTREEEVDILKEKLKLYQDREKCAESSSSNPELEQLRVFLEEKDKHIRDLMDTLKNFHDDQQRYINDTSNYSAEQIAKLAADLNRTEATNKIYHTQMEALRRQLTNVTQREKQARDLSQSLRQQLLKRPVVSIKTELNARVKNENLQKRIQQLELDLDESRAQLQRQQTLLEAKRTRSANEVGLWEKQKRWQQQAEKLKLKLDETELALEKTRTLLQAARTTIARLEKDKHMLENKLGRGGATGSANATASSGNHANALKCCRAPSCPNLQHVGAAKFTPSPSESPETYTTGPSSECSSPAHHQSQPSAGHHHSFYEQGQSELIEALKARIEMQQRKIIAMELEGRGTNALTTELEKLQERCQAIEAQNIRLEARNLQLQLDTDLLRQGDSSDRLHKRIKHLEDYILALKEEMARTESRRELCKCSGLKVNTHQGQSAEHTILSLRNLVEKLRSENKFLKDGRLSSESRSSTDSMPASAELTRLQQLHAEALEKISTLQQDLKQRSGSGKQPEELKYIKEQLQKKTQLLQKAKVLLTRAAAKEKMLREQISVWKRKCSELQNVPVIDEISE